MSYSSLCAQGICSSDFDSSLNSITSIGRIIGIVIGSLLGLAFIICIIAVLYLRCCKRKNQAQVWAQPCQRPYGGQSMPMYLYNNYPQVPVQPVQIEPHRIIEEPPPAYEEINNPENSIKK